MSNRELLSIMILKQESNCLFFYSSENELVMADSGD